MHEAGKFEFLNLAGGFPAKRTLLVTAIPRYQKTTHPRKPAIKLPTMELPKLTKSLFSQRQQQDAEGAEIRQQAAQRPANLYVFGSLLSETAHVSAAEHQGVLSSLSMNQMCICYVAFFAL